MQKRIVVTIVVAALVTLTLHSLFPIWDSAERFNLTDPERTVTLRPVFTTTFQMEV